MVHITDLQEATLFSAAFAALSASFINGEQVGITSFATNIVQFGAPVALGTNVANLFPGISLKPTNRKITDYVYRGVVAGGVAAGVLMAAGVLPLQFDVQLLSLVGLGAVSCIAGDALAMAVDISSSRTQ